MTHDPQIPRKSDEVSQILLFFLSYLMRIRFQGDGKQSIFNGNDLNVYIFGTHANGTSTAVQSSYHNDIMMPTRIQHLGHGTPEPGSFSHAHTIEPYDISTALWVEGQVYGQRKKGKK